MAVARNSSSSSSSKITRLRHVADFQTYAAENHYTALPNATSTTLLVLTSPDDVKRAPGPKEPFHFTFSCPFFLNNMTQRVFEGLDNSGGGGFPAQLHLDTTFKLLSSSCKVTVVGVTDTQGR